MSRSCRHLPAATPKVDEDDLTTGPFDISNERARSPEALAP